MKLKEIIGDFLDSKTVAEALRLANDSLNRMDSPFEIVEQAGGYRFRTRARYYPWVRKLFPDANLRKFRIRTLRFFSVVDKFCAKNTLRCSMCPRILFPESILVRGVF